MYLFPLKRIGGWFFSLIVMVSICSLAVAPRTFAQSFRGGINGTVLDASGAQVANATVTIANADTAATRAGVSSSAGEFLFADLPVGTYSVTVTAPGFDTVKTDKVMVSAGSVYSMTVKLAVSSSATTVDVSAAGIALDTTSVTQTTDLPTQVVNDIPMNARDFTQLLQFTPGFGGYSIGGGAGVASVNGNRSNEVNWQIEGTDNNDLWWNIPAVNQGGVSGIAGIVLPLDAVDQFSLVTQGTADSGRSSGGTVNLSIKSGTNQLHGTAYYFNRNEFFAAETPFAPAGTRKNVTRNISYGFSVGGPVIKDKTFYFISFEHQNFLIGNQVSSTEPSAAYQAAATSVLNYYGVPVNSVSQALLTTLWPQNALTGGANSNNYFNPGTENGHSFNGLVNLDENFNANNTLSVKWYAGQGTQIAPTASYLSPYYEAAPIHVQNYSIIYNHIFSAHLANQIFMGVNYFNQSFSDENHSYNPVALGLNTGATSADLAGAPHIVIGPPAAGSGLSGGNTGFDPIGVTPPEGRNDITGHLEDALSYTVGRHQFRFGGEFRQAQVDDFYQSGSRGAFNFDGSQGPWYYPTGGSAACDAKATKNIGTPAPGYGPTNTYDNNVLFLADFLAGCVSNSSIVEGDQKRQVFMNTWNIYAEDAWQLTAKLNLNYGVRYDYAGPISNGYANLTSFDPTQPGGFLIQGKNSSNLYEKFYGAASPRLGAAYQVNPSLVVRGGVGLYFDSPYMLPLLNLRGTTNGGAVGVGNNPAGGSPVAAASVNNYVIANGQPIFPTLQQAVAGAGVTNVFSVNHSFHPSNTLDYNINLQQSLGSSMLLQIGYVGNMARHLLEVQDINQAALGSATLNAQSYAAGGYPTCNLSASGSSYQQCTRPYYSQYPNFGTINQLNSDLNSNYNSLQVLLRTSNYHGFTTQATFTWSHALDYETGLVPYLPQNSNDLKAEYGNSDFDTRNTYSEYLTYAIPGGHVGPHLLTHGWELNSVLAFHGGQPFTVAASTNASGNGEYSDRAVLAPGVTNPFKGVSHSIVNGAVQWFSPTAFVDPAVGTYSTQRRNQFYNPGYNDVDLSIFKNTPITERVTSQLRAEMFNAFNHNNYAPVGAPTTGEGGTIGSTIGAFFGAPGIGPGEPFNIQFALKLIF